MRDNMIDIVKHNRAAWDKEVEQKNRWTIPVSSNEVAEARKGHAKFLLTPTIPVPEEWYMPVQGKSVLCLASGGGQQVPLFAALGAHVTVLDNSKKQLEQDAFVAERDHLDIITVQGDMKDLSCIEDESIDLIFHPVSNCFVDEIEPVWKECFRVLKKGGTLLAGFVNPIVFIFDLKEQDDHANLVVKYTIPYSDVDQLPDDELQDRIKNKNTLEYGHSLDAQIGEQLRAGFVLTGFFEDGIEEDLLAKHIPIMIATRAIKMQAI